jgi:membrane-associated phospholipid phosphatase
MTYRLLARKYRNAFIQSRISPITRTAVLLIFGLVTAGVTSSIATGLMITSLPNIILLIPAVLFVDVISQFTARTEIVAGVQTVIYGILFLVTLSLCAVIAAYSMQRFAFPLQDRNLENADLALGFNWSAFAHWVDRHALVQDVFHFAYHTIMPQIALPLVVLAFANRLGEVRIYLLTFAIALAVTISISILMPAIGPIIFADRSSFNVLQFTGATPIDHLTHLREPGPFILHDMPGGIATFPSFHATIAVLTPLALCRFRLMFVALLFLDAAMLGATITEGAHYFVDVMAGSCMAFFAYALAKRIIRLEDRTFDDQRDPASHPFPAAHVA